MVRQLTEKEDLSGSSPCDRRCLGENELLISEFNVFSPWEGPSFSVYDGVQTRFLGVFRTKEEAILFVESSGKTPVVAVEEEKPKFPLDILSRI